MTEPSPTDDPRAAPSRSEIAAAVEDFAGCQGLEMEAGSRDGEIVLVLPGEQKLKTVCSLLVGEHDLSLSAFVIRHPDEDHLQVYTYLLRRNLRLPGLAYAIDADGDVYVVGRLPFAAVDADALDRLLGVVVQAADEPFNELLTLGFLTSMRKEWRWRVSRGESLRNLEAFRHLLDDGSTPVDTSSSSTDPPSTGGAGIANRAERTPEPPAPS